MMRLNAPIPALLVFAVLFLLPATLLAKTTHRRAHKAVSTRTSTKAHGKTAPHAAKAKTTRTTRAAKTVHTTKTRATRTRKSTRTQLKRVHTRRGSKAAKPVSVISVARPSSDKPQLDGVAAEAATPVILPTLYNKRGRLIVPPPLKGSHEILVRQNEVADRDGLHRIQNDEDLREMRDKGMLVSLPASRTLQIDSRLPDDRRYCRPWTARFLANIARAHYARFHTPLQVNSAVRTAEFQQRLIRVNGNAAPAEGDTASPHLTGQAVDLAKHGLSRTEVAWMRGYLLPLVQEGKIDVEEEFQQSCFHISVYKKYLPRTSTPKRSITTTHRSETSSLATALQ